MAEDAFQPAPSEAIPSASEPITIFLEHNSLRNDTYNCDWAGIHYRISTPTEGIRTERLTSIYRWDKNTNEEVLVAEWYRTWGTGAGHKFKFLRRPDMPQEFQAAKDFYPMTRGLLYGGLGDRTFLAENGKRYTWKEKVFSLKLYRAEGDDTETQIAEYQRRNHFFNKQKAYIKVHPETLEFLDTLIVTFMFSEKKRRDGEKSQGKGIGGA